MGFLKGKRALIIGVASKRSIAWGAAVAFEREGAELAFTAKDQKLQKRIKEMVVTLGSDIVIPCDVTKDEDIDNLFTQLKQHWQQFDIIVHSIAYSPGDQLGGDYLDRITRDGFRIAHDISSYSFAAIAKAALPMLRPRASLITMSYLGAVRAVPNYNVMGLAKASLEANVRYMAADLGKREIRVNAISAGPIKTPAAKGISDFNKMIDYGERNSPLRRNVTINEVGNATAFLASDLASGITGDVLYVDSGYHIQAMPVM